MNLSGPLTCAGTVDGPDNFVFTLTCPTGLAPAECPGLTFDMLLGNPQTGCNQPGPAVQTGLLVEGECMTPDGPLAFQFDYAPVDYVMNISLG